MEMLHTLRAIISVQEFINQSELWSCKVFTNKRFISLFCMVWLFDFFLHFNRLDISKHY